MQHQRLLYLLIHFNPRPTNVRRRQRVRIYRRRRYPISIHAPRMWGDKIEGKKGKVNPISILAPRMWGDLLHRLPHRLLIIFQSSPHVCEATKLRAKKARLILFQSSPHVCEATARYDYGRSRNINFNPRPTYVRRRRIVSCFFVYQYFNPRPTYVRRLILTGFWVAH